MTANSHWPATLRSMQSLGAIAVVYSLGVMVWFHTELSSLPTDSMGTGFAFILFLMFFLPGLIAYLTLSVTSTLLLLKKNKRQAFGFWKRPWNYLYFFNLSSLMVAVAVFIITPIVITNVL